MNTDQLIDNIAKLPSESKKLLESCLTEVTYPKGHILLRAGKVERSIYFIRKGMVRAYSNHAGNEITFWFGSEGQAVISMKSYVEDQPGYEDIELLEDCELLELKSADLKRLFETDIHIANWGRRFAEKELIKTEERLISGKFRTASERYSDLLTNHPDLIKRVQLGHIASYLGITQVSLSRIRSKT
ncbi:Cyclic nucleotide-binding domain protein [compost metagenome]